MWGQRRFRRLQIAKEWGYKPEEWDALKPAQTDELLAFEGAIAFLDERAKRIQASRRSK